MNASTPRNRFEIAAMEWLGERDEYEQVDCPEPECGARAGETCRRITDGGELGHLTAHHRRITAARKAAHPTEEP